MKIFKEKQEEVKNIRRRRKWKEGRGNEKKEKNKEEEKEIWESGQQNPGWNEGENHEMA